MLTVSADSFKLYSTCFPLSVSYFKHFMSQRKVSLGASWLLDLAYLRRILATTWSCSWFSSVSAMDSSWSCTFHHLGAGFGTGSLHMGCRICTRFKGCWMCRCLAVWNSLFHFVVPSHPWSDCRQLLQDLCISACYSDAVSTCRKIPLQTALVVFTVPTVPLQALYEGLSMDLCEYPMQCCFSPVSSWLHAP